jgi:phosphocarrier protein HPr
MIRQQIEIQNKLGLHTRAAAKLVDLTKKFSSHIEIMHQNRVVNSKSIMSVITLGAKKNDIVDFMIDGSDENEALIAITNLINNRFGEAE